MICRIIGLTDRRTSGLLGRQNTATVSFTSVESSRTLSAADSSEENIEVCLAMGCRQCQNICKLRCGPLLYTR